MMKRSRFRKIVLRASFLRLLDKHFIRLLFFICVAVFLSKTLMDAVYQYKTNNLQLTNPFSKGKTDYNMSLFRKVLNGSETIEDSIMVELVRNLFLNTPSLPESNYNFDRKPVKLDGQFGAPLIVDKILGEKQNGFFVEAGAFDGEVNSNSLFFELQRNYTGILIEPGIAYGKLIQRNRKASSLNVCLSTKSVPLEADFMDCDEVGGIKGEVRGWAAKEVEGKGKPKKLYAFHSIQFYLP